MTTRAMLTDGKTAIYSHGQNEPETIRATMRRLIENHGPDVLPVILGTSALPGTTRQARAWSYLDADTPDLSHLPGDYDRAAAFKDSDSGQFTAPEIAARFLLTANGNTAATGHALIVPGIGVLGLMSDDTRTTVTSDIYDSHDVQRLGEIANGDVLLLDPTGTVDVLKLARVLPDAVATGQIGALLGSSGGKVGITGDAYESSGMRGFIVIETEVGSLYLDADTVVSVG